MLKRIRVASTLLAFALACCLTATPQETKPGDTPDSGQKPAASSPGPSDLNAYQHSQERYFRLDFRVLDLSAEGKVVDSRAYSQMIASGLKSAGTSSLRTGDRVPVSTSANSFQYMDTGTNIDVREAETDGQTLRLHVSATISTLATAGDLASLHAAQPSADRPILREASWSSDVSVPIGKPAVIFSSDNNADRGRMELELTAVPLAK